MTTAIIPFGAFTIPSKRREATCKPALPGGRLAVTRDAASCRLVKDSNGSRRATFHSVSASAVLGAALAAFFATGLGAFVAGLPAGFAGAVCACALNAAVASSIPSSSVFNRRIARSFPLTVFSRALRVLLHRPLPPESYQPAW